MADTIALEELEKYADNVYEAIIMMARRARQINDQQKQLLEEHVEQYVSDESLDEDGFNQDLVDHQYLKLPKPTTIAMQEMLEGKLVKEYPEQD